MLIFLEFWRQAARDPQAWKAVLAPYRRYRTFFARLVAQGIAEGTLRPVDPDMAAAMIVALAVGLLLQGVLDPQGADWPQITHESLQLMIKGIEQGPPRASP